MATLFEWSDHGKPDDQVVASELKDRDFQLEVLISGQVATSHPGKGTQSPKRKVGALLVEPLQVKIKAITTEGERVAVEVEVSGPTKDGRRYENQMHILYVVRDGKIVVVKEYHDTLHASLILGP